jgi:hypothetical protein
MAPLFLFYTCLVLDRYRMSELSVKNLLKNAHIYIYIYINHTPVITCNQLLITKARMKKMMMILFTVACPERKRTIPSQNKFSYNSS